MKTLFIITFLLLMTPVVFSQCESSIDSVCFKNLVIKNPDTINVCRGDTITLFMHYYCDSIYLIDNFNAGTLDSGWVSNCSPMFNNPCGAGVDGSIYCWVGPATSFPRRLVTNTYYVDSNTTIQFDMKYASQADSSPCEGPDESTEGVHLQYSTISSNGPWTDIGYWDPNDGYDTNLTSWQHYSVNIPVTGTVWISWYQDVTSGNEYDHWGIDNVFIVYQMSDTSIVTSYLYQNNTVVAQNIHSYSVVPIQDCDYKLITYTTNNLFVDSLHVHVYDPILTIQNLDSVYYLNSPSVVLTGNPQPGSFTGPGIVNGNTFDPSVAGAGTYAITYHHYYINSNISDSIAGTVIFEDDFSADKGWTGYGTEWTRGSATASTSCSGSQDPSEDHTASSDNYIIGNWIGGCYQNSMTQTFWLTSPPIDCSLADTVEVSFYSCSGIESPTFDHLYVEAYDGTTWQQIWTNTSSVNETSWTLKTFNVVQAAHNPNFRIRFGIGVTDGSVTYKGWNIDDFKVWGNYDSPSTMDNMCEFTLSQQVTVLNEMLVNEIQAETDFPAKVSILTIDGKFLLKKEVNSMQEIYRLLKPYSEGLYFYSMEAKNMKIGKLIYSK